jgi:phage tail-like protein
MNRVNDSGLVIDYVPDAYHRYGGETVTLAARLRVAEPAAGLTVRVWLSPKLSPQLAACRVPALFGPARLAADKIDAGTTPQRPPGRYNVIIWQQLEAGSLQPKRAYEFEVAATVQPPGQSESAGSARSPVEPLSWVEIMSSEASTHSRLVKLTRPAQPRCLTYLPGIYHEAQQEFLWRYLMIFDRVWGLYEELLSNQAAYFDPQLTPGYLKSWLADWVGCRRYRHLPEPVWLRLAPKLIPQMVYLHQRRGTKAGLAAYLKFWLELESAAEQDRYIQIEEAVAGNFTLGNETRLSDQLIMGSADRPPGYFKVTITQPPDREPLSEAFFREVIDEWKPAHAIYELKLGA